MSGLPGLCHYLRPLCGLRPLRQGQLVQHPLDRPVRRGTTAFFLQSQKHRKKPNNSKQTKTEYISKVSSRIRQPGVSILWLGEVESLICNFYLSVAARKLVETDRPWDTLACCWDAKQPSNQETASTTQVRGKGNNRFLPTESETAPRTPALHPTVLSVEREQQISSYRVRNSPTDPSPHSAVLSVGREQQISSYRVRNSPTDPSPTLQSCPLHTEARTQFWPRGATLQEELWGSPGQLGKTSLHPLHKHPRSEVFSHRIDE